MKDYKKILVILLITVFISSVLFIGTGCKEEAAEEEVSEETTEEVTEEKEEEAAKEEVTEPITIVTWDESIGDEAGIKIERELQIIFDESHPNIIIERLPVPAEKKGDRVAFANAMMAETGPDAYHRAYFSQLPVWVDEGFCYPLDEYIEEWEHKDNVYDIIWDVVNKDGKTWGIPGGGGVNKGMAVYSVSLMYRKDLFEEAGLDPDKPPATWDELVDYAKKLTDPEKGQYGFGVLGGQWVGWIWENFVWQAGGEVTTLLDDGNVELTFTDEAGVEALQFYQDLALKHKVTQENVLMEWGDLKADFVSGRQAMCIYPNSYISYFMDAGLTIDQIGCANLPAGPGATAVQIGGNNWMLNPDSSDAERDAAWEYIKYMISPETIKKRWELETEYGLTVPELTIYKDLMQPDYVDMPESWKLQMGEALKYGRLEYVFKDRIDEYLNAPIQEVLLDINADPAEALAAAAKTIVKDVDGTVLTSELQ